MENEVRNMRVLDAGYYFTGHYCLAPLRIVLEDSGFDVEVNPKFFDSSDLYEIFQVFDIDHEDEQSLQEIEGKYCRVWFDKDRKVRALQHLTKDDVIWYVNKEDNEDD